jgi:hypothetical protein
VSALVPSPEDVLAAAAPQLLKPVVVLWMMSGVELRIQTSVEENKEVSKAS